MLDTLALLSLPDDQAQKQIVKSVVKPTVNVDELTLGAPQASQGTDLVIPVSPDGGVMVIGDTFYTGDVSVRFHRVNLGALFTGISPAFRLPMPTTTAAVAALIRQALNVRMDTHDFVEEAIDTNERSLVYRFKAAATSQRWVGFVDIRLFKFIPDAAELSIDGFYYPE